MNRVPPQPAPLSYAQLSQQVATINEAQGIKPDPQSIAAPQVGAASYGQIPASNPIVAGDKSLNNSLYQNDGRSSWSAAGIAQPMAQQVQNHGNNPPPIPTNMNPVNASQPDPYRTQLETYFPASQSNYP